MLLGGGGEGDRVEEELLHPTPVAFLVQQLGPDWKLLLEADEGAVH